MRRIIFSFFIIISAFAFSVAAQTPAHLSFEKGIKAAGGGKYEAALASFKTSLAFTPDDKISEEFRAKLHFNIGVCLYRLARSAEAVGELEKAIKLSGGVYEKAFYALGMAETTLKNWKKAEQAFLGAIRLNKNNGETWLDLAFVYLAEKDYEAARAAFRKSIEHKSVDSSIAHNNLGVILALGGDLEAAVKEFETAVSRSGGKLAVAGRNLRFCRQMGQNFDRELVARLEFSEDSVK